MTALPPCPRTPNCVSTESVHPRHRIEPIPYTGTLAAAEARLLSVLRAIRGATVRQAGEGHWKVEFRTLVFRFVDDAEFVLDEGEKRIHFRSASRLGRSDFGVNRRRMERIRKDFEAAPGVGEGGVTIRSF